MSFSLGKVVVDNDGLISLSVTQLKKCKISPSAKVVSDWKTNLGVKLNQRDLVNRSHGVGKKVVSLETESVARFG